MGIPGEYRRFLSSAVVVLYKVTASTELANPEPLPGGNTRLGFYEPLVTAISSITMLKVTMLNVCYDFIITELEASNTVTQASGKLI